MRRNLIKLLGAAALLATAINVDAGGTSCNALIDFCTSNGCTPSIYNCDDHQCVILCTGPGSGCNWGPTACYTT